MKIPIYGLEKFSLVEWPGKISGVVFTGGCNFRCPFCHNPELIDLQLAEKNRIKPFPWPEIEDFLKEKKSWLDAIIVTGGEPTLHENLPDFFRLIKEMGYLTALETNGSNPEMLKRIIEENLADRIQMDIKSSLTNYGRAIGLKEPPLKKIERSIKLLMKSNLEYEFRTTVVPGLVGEEDITKIGEMIAGAEKIVLQQFRPIKTFDKKYQKALPYTQVDLEKMSEKLKKFVKKIEINGIA